MSQNQNKAQNLKKQASLYAIIAICMLIAGTASYLTAKRNIASEPERTNFSVVITAKSTEGVSDSKVNEAVSGIPDERTQPYSQESTTQIISTTQNANLIIRAESFTLPVESSILKGYSDSRVVYSKTTDDWRSHNGIDLAGNMGDPVCAVNNGIVTSVYNDTLWGTVVEIDHGDGLTAKYCGLGNGSTVKVGDEVKINQRIGNLSEVPIEKGDGIHLHFETTLDGITVNPIIALGMNENDFR